MLNHVFSNRPELYNYTHCAYGKPSYLFYGSSVIMSEDGTQQGDPEAPPLFAETIHILVKHKNKNKRRTPHFRISNRRTLPKRIARRKN